MQITFPDGSVREYENGTNALDIAASLSQGLRKAVICCEIDGKRADAFMPIEKDCSLKLLTFEDEDGRWTYRHTASHILAQAVKRLWPEVKLAIGPAIKEGFYYDFDAPFTFSTEDFKKIEKEMERISRENLRLERFELPREEAVKFMEEKGEPYKVELINDLPEGEPISFYRQGEFVDLCAGTHVSTTARIKNIKLLSVAGAYWRGSEKNKMLQRIYGTAFEKKEDLQAYLTKLEEAKKRDHRKL
ncbi:MAG: TGS domain-containing protein, partial [Clostridia bacterium]|nr:TGS domain-containing protein [Clostridia bacterium]